MTFLPGPKFVWARLSRATAVAALISFSFGVQAQESLPEGVTSDVVDVLLETRLQRPAAQASAEERQAVVEELKNIYAVTELPEAKELADDPSVKAQLELQHRVLIFNTFITNYLQNNEPSDQEVFDAYQENVALVEIEEFKARHILVETQSAATDLIAQLDGGAEFAKLAEEHSTGPSATSGGDLGWFSGNQMVKPFSDAVALLENGSYTKSPVQTNFGWHVILREDSRAGTPPTLESVRDVIAQRLTQEKLIAFIEGLSAPASE